MRRLLPRQGFHQKTSVVPARAVTERSVRGPRCTARACAHLGRAALLLMFALAGPSAAGQSSQDTWRYELERGRSLALPKWAALTNGCKRAHRWRAKKRKGGFIRFDRRVNHITVNPGSREWVGIIIDANRKEKLYVGSMEVECLDCSAEPGCKIQNRSVFRVELTVIKPVTGEGGRGGSAEQITAGLVSKLEQLSSLLEERIGKLEVVEGELPDGRREKGYPAEQVERITGEVRERLIEATRANELRALGTYAIKHYCPECYLTTVSVRTVEVVSPHESSPIFFTISLRPRASVGPPAERLIVTVASAERAFNSIRKLLAVLKANSGRMTLRVVSIPEGANVELVAPGGKTYTRGTNSDIEDFWAGTYRLRVAKEGFVTIVQDNQDVGFGNRGIECQLVKAGVPILCKFK